MKVPEAIFISILGLAGSAMGSYFTAKAASESAQIQGTAARDTARAEVALKIMEFRASPMADVYAANSKLQAAKLGPEMDSAAKQLAVASASASARLDGVAGSICLDIAEKANFFAGIPDDMLIEKAHARGELASRVTELRREFETMQRQTVSIALF